MADADVFPSSLIPILTNYRDELELIQSQIGKIISDPQMKATIDKGGSIVFYTAPGPNGTRVSDIVGTPDDLLDRTQPGRVNISGTTTPPIPTGPDVRMFSVNSNTLKQMDQIRNEYIASGIAISNILAQLNQRATVETSLAQAQDQLKADPANQSLIQAVSNQQYLLQQRDQEIKQVLNDYIVNDVLGTSASTVAKNKKKAKSAKK